MYASTNSVICALHIRPRPIYMLKFLTHYAFEHCSPIIILQIGTTDLILADHEQCTLLATHSSQALN